MKKNIAQYILFFGVTIQSVSAATLRLKYTFTKKENNTINIKIAFLNPANQVQSILLPSEWAGQKNLYRAISDIKIVKGEARLILTNRPDSIVISNLGSRRFTISYDLIQDLPGPLNYPFYFRPIIQDSIFFITGYSGLAYPDLPEQSAIDCSIEYVGFSKNDVTGNSFFYNKKSSNISTTIGEFRNAFYFAGNMRYKIFDRPGSKLIIALKGNYAFPDEKLYSDISRLIYAERQFWKDTLDPYFIVTLLPVESATTGGTAYHNSFSIFYNPKFKITQGLQYLIAHEYFHTWIGQKLKQMNPEESGKWFVEGFTDFYAYKMLLQTGLISDDEYLAKLNDIFRRYYLSPLFTYKNDGMVDHYFENANIKQLAYNRGSIIAMLLNGVIESNNKGSLDDFIRDFFEASSGDKIFNEAMFFRVLEKYVTKDVINIVKDINEGKNDGILNTLSVKGYKAEHNELLYFDIGFDLAESKKNGKITGLVQGSAAWIAGLREGDIQNAISVWNGDPGKPARITVKQNGQDKIIEYLPARKSGTIGLILKKEK